MKAFRIERAKIVFEVFELKTSEARKFNKDFGFLPIRTVNADQHNSFIKCSLPSFKKKKKG